MKNRVEQALKRAEEDFKDYTEQIEVLQEDIVEANNLIKEGTELKTKTLEEIKAINERRQKVTGVIEFLKGWEEE